MKKTILCLILMVLFSGTALAFKDKPHVNVFGVGIIEVVPDEMFWTLRVENNGMDIKELAGRHSKIVSDLIGTLTSNGIPEDEIQTTRMKFGERWEHQKGRRVKAGFFSSSIITFRLTDFDRYQRLWQALADVQGMNIQDVTFGCSEKNQVQIRARRLAIGDAETKAKEMAGALRCGLGVPLQIEEIPVDQGVYRTNMLMAKEAGGASGPVKSYSPGKIKIESRVGITFSLKCMAQNP